MCCILYHIIMYHHINCSILYLTGRWQLSDVHPFLVKYAPLLRGWSQRSQRTVLIPLTGKSVDIFWLHQQAVKQVIGIESSFKAIHELFTQHHITTYTYTRVSDHINKYSALNDSIVIYEADIFNEELANVIPPVDWVWDRAAIVALHWVDHP